MGHYFITNSDLTAEPGPHSVKQCPLRFSYPLWVSFAQGNYTDVCLPIDKCGERHLYEEFSRSHHQQKQQQKAHRESGHKMVSTDKELDGFPPDEQSDSKDGMEALGVDCTVESNGGWRKSKRPSESCAQEETVSKRSVSSKARGASEEESRDKAAAGSVAGKRKKREKYMAIAKKLKVCVYVRYNPPRTASGGHSITHTQQ